MALFKKGESGNKAGRPAGSGRNKFCEKWAEKKGLPYLARLAEGFEKEPDGREVGHKLRASVAEWLSEQGIGKAPQRLILAGDKDNPISLSLADLLAKPDDGA